MLPIERETGKYWVTSFNWSPVSIGDTEISEKWIITMPRHGKYEQIADGDTVILPQDRPYRMACCGEDAGGCNLVHDLLASITSDGEIALQVFRNDRETRRQRRIADRQAADAVSPLFITDSQQRNVPMTRSRRRAQRDHADIVPDGTVLRVPLTMMDGAFVNDLRQRFPPTRDAAVTSHRAARRAARQAASSASTVDDAKRITEVALLTQQVMARDGFITDDEAAAHRPGFRFADQVADPSKRRKSTVNVAHTARGHTVEVSTTEESNDAMSARDAYILEMCDAWRVKDDGVEVAPWSKTQAVPNRPQGAWGPSGFAAKAGDPCTSNGAPGVLSEKGGWLYCDLTPLGPTRVTPTNTGADGVTGDRSLQDAAWREMVESQQNAWKTPA